MALLYIDGFETYNTAQLITRWQEVTGTGVIVAAEGRRGGSAFKVGFGVAYLVRVVPTAATLIVGFAYKISSPTTLAPCILSRFLDGSGTEQVHIELNASTRAVDIYRGGTKIASGAIPIASDTYYYFEFKATFATAIAANTCQVRVNGVVDADVPAGTSTRASANSSANRVQVGSNGTGSTYWYDDVYICDGTGSRLNDFLGDKRVDAVLPDSDGSQTAWTANGAVNDWDCVKQPIADGDTTYVASATVGAYDTFGFANLVAGAAAVDAIQLSLTARKDDAGSRSLAPALVVGGTTYDGAAVGLTDSYGVASQVWEQNPNTAANWTESDVNALEAGAKLVG